MQASQAEEILRSLTPDDPGFVSLVSFTELVWVLRSRYRVPKRQLIVCLERLLDAPELEVENHAAVSHALRRFCAANADFADCLIERSGYLAGCHETVTFDIDAAKTAGMRLV